MTEEIKNPVKLLTAEDEKWKEKYIERQLQSSCRRKSVTVDGSIYRVMKAISFLRGQPLGETYSIAVYEWASKRYPELIKDVQAQFQEDLEKSIQQESEQYPFFIIMKNKEKKSKVIRFDSPFADVPGINEFGKICRYTIPRPQESIKKICKYDGKCLLNSRNQTHNILT